MNFNVRGAVIQNLTSMSEQELRELVDDSIKQGKEQLLPGLGVVLELIWSQLDDSEQGELITKLHQHLSSGSKS